MVRICFQIELAHWYYIDFCRQDDPELPACGMKAFMAISILFFVVSQPAFTCSKLTIETLEQGVKYVQS